VAEWNVHLIAGFEETLRGNLLQQLWNRLSAGTYFPPPVRGVETEESRAGPNAMGSDGADR